MRRIHKLRTDLESEIERLIAFLDALDGDPDIEDDDPAEDEHDRENDRADDEPDVDPRRQRIADARRPRCTRIERLPAAG